MNYGEKLSFNIGMDYSCIVTSLSEGHSDRQITPLFIYTYIILMFTDWCTAVQYSFTSSFRLTLSFMIPIG
jgi:hypothetical protein